MPKHTSSRRIATRKKLPAHTEVRPIGARPLKSVMDTLRPFTAEQNVLDLFAGFGRLGLGALKEGASTAVFVENDPHTFTELRRRAAIYGTKAQAVRMDVFRFLTKQNPSACDYSLIFADPPFAFWNPSFESKLFEAISRVAAIHAIFVVKHPARMLISNASFGFRAWKQSTFGESKVTYFRYGNPE